METITITQTEKKIQRGKNMVIGQRMGKYLLICGIISSLLYAFMNIICARLYDGYSSFSQTVSELSAIGAPTRPLWVVMGIIYTSFVALFGWDIWKSASESRQLRIVGILLLTNGIIGLFWPPMHQREVLAAGGGTLTDTMHIVFSIVTVFIMMLSIGFGAAAFGKLFRRYSIITLVVLIFYGALTGMQAPTLQANLDTPWLGVWERICIGAFLLWMMVLAIVLLRHKTLKKTTIASEGELLTHYFPK